MAGGGFLPPEPPGPEPDIGPRPESAAPPPPPQQEPPSQAGWQQPPPSGYWQPQWQPPGPQEPDNGPAVAGFVLALIGAVLLLLSVLPRRE